MKYIISGEGQNIEVTGDHVLLIVPDDMPMAEALDDPADNPRILVADLQELLDEVV